MKIGHLTCGASFIVFLLFIAPFFYLTRFTFMSGDDFCRAVTGLDSFFQNISHWFTTSGRYTNAFLSYFPVYGKEVYRWTLFISMSAVLVTLFYYVHRILSIYELQVAMKVKIFIALIFAVVVYSQLPNIYEFFYWYAAVTVYLYSIIFFMLLLPRILLLGKHSGERLFLSAFLVVLLVGNNEMFILITNFLLGVTLLFKYLMTKKIDLKILFLNVLSWMTSFLVLFMPGTGARQAHYPEGGEVIYSLKWAVLSSGMFIIKSLLQFPYVLLFLGLFLYLINAAKRTRSTAFFIHPVVLFILSYIGLMLVFFVPLYATGHIAVNSGRIGNVVHLIFLILLFLNIVNLAGYVSRYELKLNINSFLLPFMVLISLASLLFSGNYQGLLADLSGEELKKYEEQVEARYERLRKEEGVVRVQKIKGTNLLKYYDITFDAKSWENHCYVEMVNYNYEKNLEAITLESEQKFKERVK